MATRSRFDPRAAQAKVEAEVVLRKARGNRQGAPSRLLADGKLRKLPVDIPVRHLRIHPDGRQIAFLSGDRTREIRVRKNFLTDKGRALP